MEGPADRKSAHVMQPNPIPEQSTNTIEVLLLAWVISTGDHTRTCLETSKIRAREAVDLFLSGDSPLPGSIDRGTELLDGARFPEFCRSYLGEATTRPDADSLSTLACNRWLGGALTLDAGCRAVQGFLAD